MIDLSRIKEETAGTGGGNFVKLENEGDTVCFYVPPSSELKARYTVWTGSGSKDCEPGTEGAKKRLVASVVVVSEKGVKLPIPTTKVFESSPMVWDRIGKATTKAGGALVDHLFEVERIGEKGDKKTTYRIKVVGKAADYTLPASGTPAAASPPPAETKAVDVKAELIAELTKQGKTPVQVAAMIAIVAPGKSLPVALTVEEAAKLLAMVRAAA